MYVGRYGGRGGPQARRGVCALHGVRELATWLKFPYSHAPSVSHAGDTQGLKQGGGVVGLDGRVAVHAVLQTGLSAGVSGSTQEVLAGGLGRRQGQRCRQRNHLTHPFCLVGEEKKAQREKANSKKQPCSAEGPLTHNTRPSPSPCTWCLPWTLSDGKGLSHGDGVCMDDCSERVNN